MQYKGKLYGHLGKRRYFDTGKTADDWDKLEKRITELEAQIRALTIPTVVGRSEKLNCDYCDEPFGEEHEKDKYACKDCRDSW